MALKVTSTQPTEPEGSPVTQEEIERLLDSPYGTSHALTVLRDTNVNLGHLIAAIEQHYDLPRHRLKRALLRALEALLGD